MFVRVPDAAGSSRRLMGEDVPAGHSLVLYLTGDAIPARAPQSAAGPRGAPPPGVREPAG